MELLPCLDGKPSGDDGGWPLPESWCIPRRRRRWLRTVPPAGRAIEQVDIPGVLTEAEGCGIRTD